MREHSGRQADEADSVEAFEGECGDEEDEGAPLGGGVANSVLASGTYANGSLCNEGQKWMLSTRSSPTSASALTSVR